MTEDFESSFRADRLRRVSGFAGDHGFNALAQQWVFESMKREYLYNFDWLGRPIIQYPQDIVALQEIIWKVRPSLIIETGIAHGGSLVLSASLLALLDYTDAVIGARPLAVADSRRQVVGVDIEIRNHNRHALNLHPLRHLMTMIEGSSTDAEIVHQVQSIATRHDSVVVILDSNHTHQHVLTELRAYAPLVTVGSYCVVFDTFVENMPEKVVENRPWDRGNSPLSAVRAFLNETDCFVPDVEIDHKLLISAAPSGYLRRTR